MLADVFETKLGAAAPRPTGDAECFSRKWGAGQLPFTKLTKSRRSLAFAFNLITAVLAAAHAVPPQFGRAIFDISAI